MASLIEQLKPLLLRSADDPRPVVLMTCGMAGAGKSTLSKAILDWKPEFARLSIDQTIYENHGLYQIDFPVEKIGEYQDEAEAQIKSTFDDLLKAGTTDVILDRAFYSKDDRMYYKKLIEEAGARWVLVYLKAPSKDMLWARICARRAKGVDADCALDISRQLLDSYWAGFEGPEGEGEIVVDIE